MNIKLLSPLPLLVLLATLALTGCKPYAVAQPGLAPDDAVGVTEGDGAVVQTDARVVDLRKSAEQRLFPQMKPEVVEFIRAQEFFAEVTPAEFTMLETFRDTDKAAQKYGTEALFMDTLNLATQQAWYTDGFDDNEAKHLTALFRAYQSSVTMRKLGPFDQIGPQLASSIRGNYFYVLNLPERGEVTVVVAAEPQNERLASQAVQLTVDNLREVESIVGEFPFAFVHIMISEPSPGYAANALGEFIIVSPEAVDTETISHELTHTTIYGAFPIWFEEGLAYFVGRSIDGTLESNEAENLALLETARLPRKIDLSLKFDHSGFGLASAYIQGFLFFEGLEDVVGIDGLGALLRSLRGKTYANDNELLRAIVTNSPPDKQQQVQTYLCGAVLGLRSGC